MDLVGVRCHSVTAAGAGRLIVDWVSAVGRVHTDPNESVQMSRRGDRGPRIPAGRRQLDRAVEAGIARGRWLGSDGDMVTALFERSGARQTGYLYFAGKTGADTPRPGHLVAAGPMCRQVSRSQ